MRLPLVFHVARKEILATLRDRRAIVSSLLIPLLILPVVMLGLPLLLGGLFEREQATTTEIAISGLANLPTELRENLESQNISFVEQTDLDALVRDGAYQVALSIPDDFDQSLREQGSASIELFSKRGNLRSELNAEKIEDAVDAFSEDIVTARLADVGLSQDDLKPVTIKTTDASSEAER